MFEQRVDKTCGIPIVPKRGKSSDEMHTSLHIGDTMVLVSNGRCTGQLDFQGFASCRSPFW